MAVRSTTSTRHLIGSPSNRIRSVAFGSEAPIMTLLFHRPVSVSDGLNLKLVGFSLAIIAVVANDGGSFELLRAFLHC